MTIDVVVNFSGITSRVGGFGKRVKSEHETGKLAVLRFRAKINHFLSFATMRCNLIYDE